MSVTAIILAGGFGKRMESATPKQFLPLGNKRVVEHSLDLFCHHPQIDEVILVCEESYRGYFSPSLRFALPGERRQDSLFNGLEQAHGEWICIHDGARPFVTADQLTALIEAGKRTGAATLALPVRGTMKQSKDGKVEKTLDRSTIWEAQTPQLIKRTLLEGGFALAMANGLTVTDDVSFAELMGAPVELVKGSAHNFKLTTPEDYHIAQALYATL